MNTTPPMDATPSTGATASVDAQAPTHTAQNTNAAQNAESSVRWPVRVGWTLHWALRMVLAFHLLVYGGAKLFLIQMGMPDFGDALIAYGQMSPQGLLWRFMGFSPQVQFLAGFAEVLAAALLIWGRTAFLGAILGALDMAIVFGLNLAFDVPVKYLALALTVGCVLVMLPYWRRVLALVTGAAAPAAARPQILPWPRLARVGGWLGAAAAVLVAVVPTVGGLVFISALKQDETPLPGVYQVVQDAQPAAGQLAEDTRWQQVAFGQWAMSDERQFSVRTADGELRRGSYQHTGDDTILVKLDQPLQGDLGLLAYETETESTLTWAGTADGGLRLTGDGVDVTLAPDAEHRYLFDRDFSWAPRVPVNR